MYINQGSIQYKQFQDFEKYAQFICEDFGISVVLEATKAETDGKTIYLPNVMSMTAKELDMMYAILLHEAGHIRYSSFDAAYFSALKSEAHAFLANAIEDARIENLLLKDFGGAKEIFEKLYCDYTNDKTLMRKIFKFSGSKPDLFNCLAFYIHSKIAQFKTSSLEEISGVYKARKIAKFFRDNKIDEIIEKNQLNTDKDVIDLTNDIYDLFVKFVKDNSNTLNFAEDQKIKDKFNEALNNLKNEAFTLESEIAEIKKSIIDKNQELKEFEKEHEDEISSCQQDINNIDSIIEDMNDVIRHKKYVSDASKNISKIENNINKSKTNIQKQEQSIKDLSNKLDNGYSGASRDLTDDEKNKLQEMKVKFESGVDNKNRELTDEQKSKLEEKINKLEKGITGSGKPLTDEQISAIKKKLEDKKTQLEKSKETLNQYEQSLNDNNKSLQNELNNAPNIPELMNKDLQELSEKIEKLNKEKEDFQKKLDSIYDNAKEITDAIDKYEQQIEKLQSDFMEKSSVVMTELDSVANKEDLNLDILPELNYEDAWPEAANAQKNFDKKATSETGKMVRNGQKTAGLFGTNLRDIVTFIDKTQLKVEEIDPVSLFKDKVGTSKLSDFNSTSKQLNYVEDKSIVGVYGTYREHIPLTTIYDTITKENFSSDVKEKNRLIHANIQFYQDLKKVFAKKFKFAKKQFWKGGQEDGELDVRNLWKLPTNQGDDYYEVNNPKLTNKAAATILVDISGSQSKDSTGNGERLKELALGLSLALDEVHIKHEVLGYHAPVCDEMRSLNASEIYTRKSNKLDTVVYKEASQKDNIGILNIEPQMSDNSDGESLRIAMKRLKAIRAKSHMIFIISDGKPFLSDTNISVLDEDLRTALRQAVKDKIQVFGLGFFDQLEHFLGNRFCNASDYKDVIKFFNQMNFS